MDEVESVSVQAGRHNSDGEGPPDGEGAYSGPRGGPYDGGHLYDGGQRPAGRPAADQPAADRLVGGQHDEDELLRSIGREVLRLTRRRIMTPEGSTLDRSVFRILWALAESGPSTMAELETALHLEQSTVSRQVKAAIGRGLVESHMLPGSRRRLFQATSEGARIYQQEAVLQSDVFKKALAEFGPARFRSFTTELTALNDALDHAATAADPATSHGFQ
ncbi:MarR family winged helix-turn-helix transcriptional regulator [Frankia sp. R82]|uniref:MarR family winged helix-turn-helix transcriptional regulator n=1 Tax=Frankia sp. R82 TaxID=2950553 RepID=UPI002043F925|nr:MarR family winged helix-turn-helix transcriptional regulator [Frankia sp. R82]MCM3883676.1 MarR family winged helix-turn-helix transcriptional regulator [Frankia sp. R82]